MNVKNLVSGFVPLVLFSLLTPFTGAAIGALIGLAAAVVVLLQGRRDGIKVLPLVTAAALAVVAVLGALGGHGVDDFLADYGRGLVGLVLAGYILLTARFAPFTAQFARRTVPEKLWHEAKFVRLNTRISAAWGVAVLAVAVAHLVSGTLSGGSSDHALGFLLNWGVLVVSFGLALRYTRDAVTQVEEPGRLRAGTSRAAQQ